MTAIVYALLITLGLISSADDFDMLTVEEQQELIITEDLVF